MLLPLLLLVIFSFMPINGAHVKQLAPMVPSENYTHSLIVDEDAPEQYIMLWKLINEHEIQFELHVKTTGWVGMGISPNGGMPGSDIVIGWVKDNKPYLKDCHAESKTRPILDKQQDYILLDGAEIDGYTILKFKRKLITCDLADDKNIKMETQYMIFAWNNADPLTGDGDWAYHGTAQRFSRVTILLTFKNESLNVQNALPSNLITSSLRADNIKVPAKDTFYMCEVHQLPKFDKPVHLIQFEILINSNNKRNFHHLLLYECEESFQTEPNVQYECGSVQLPDEISYGCLQKQIMAWGIGGEPIYSFPLQAGYRINPSEGKMLLVEIHYDNPDLKDDIVDDSGIKLYFTEELREHDIGLLILGTPGNPLDIHIPPNTNRIEVTSICYPECTDKYIPENDITVLTGFLHTHLAGRSVKTTLVRNGVAIRELFENKNYNFNYQFAIDIEPYKLKKGDALITTCAYETKDRNNFTTFGFGTRDEMCYDFVYYYPRIPSFAKCLTYDTPRSRSNFYRSLAIDGLVPDDILALNEENYWAVQFYIDEFFRTKVNSTPNLVRRFEEFFSSKPNKSYFCGDPWTTDYLQGDNVLYYEPRENAIKDDNENCKSLGNSASPTNVLIYSFFNLFICLIFKFN